MLENRQSVAVKSVKVTSIGIKLLSTLRANPEGMKVEALAKTLNLGNRRVYRHLYKLRQLNYVKHVFPVWSLCQFQALPSELSKWNEGKDVQAHKFSFTLHLMDKPDWWEQRENRMMRLKDFQYKPVKWGNNKYDMLARDDFMVQFFSNAIVFINQRKYLAYEPFDAFIEALEDTMKVYEMLEGMFRFKFFKHGLPQFTARSHHYVKMSDAIAARCKKERQGFEVVINGNRRAWVDFSDPFGIEFGHKNYAPEDTHHYGEFVGDVIEKKAPLPSEQWQRVQAIEQGIAKPVQQLADILPVYSENIRSHIGAIQTLGKGVVELVSTIKELKEVIRK